MPTETMRTEAEPESGQQEPARFHQKLVIVSHCTHFWSAGRFYAYAPYAREIEIWADLFDEILIAAPRRDQEPPGDCAPIDRANVRVAPQRELGGETFGAKLKLALGTPLMAWDLCMAMRQADAIHVRCPGNIAVPGTLLAPLFSKKLVAKFAGQWSPSGNEPWSTRFQRAVLSSNWWHGPVTVYGRWPNQPAHVIPFFNSALTKAQLSRARVAISRRSPEDLRHVLFVGRLSRAKNVDVLLEALGELHKEGAHFRATIAGEGPQLGSLQKLASDLGIGDAVEFTGGVSFERIIELLERSGILVLASETEGWPKAIVEAMAFGLVTVGSQIGLVPEIMGEGRGLMVKPRDVPALTDTLRKVLAAPQEYADMRARAAEWASHYSIESLRDSLRSLLAERWSLPVAEEPKAKRKASPALS